MRKRRMEDAQMLDRTLRFFRRRHHCFDRHGFVVHGADRKEHKTCAVGAGEIVGGW